MMFKRICILAILVFVLGAQLAYATWNGTASAWPASSSGTDISDPANSTASLNDQIPGNGPSGLAWHSRLQKLLFVSDTGYLVSMNVDGSSVTHWHVSGDLEDVAIVDPASNYVYIDNEDGSIIKYDMSTSSIVQTWVTPTSNPNLREIDGWAGVEGFTYVPEAGYFLMGHQHDGVIYIVDLSGSSLVVVGSFTPLPGYTDISGLYYRDGYVYVLYDSANLLAKIEPDGTVNDVWSVPGADQEGIAIGEDSNGDGDANIYIAQDSGGVIMYDNFPLPSVPAYLTDADGDGIMADQDCDDADAAMGLATAFYVDADYDGHGSSSMVPLCEITAPVGYSSDMTDCNDSDSSVYAMANFYIDSDGDGLGSQTIVPVCAVAAPYGYASNFNDTNDSIPNAGVEISGDYKDNDGDGIFDEANTVAENGYHPYYGSLSVRTNSKGKILSVWGLVNGQVAIQYGDNSIYYYDVFPLKNPTSRITVVNLIAGGGYVNVTLGKMSARINGYTGNVK